MINRNTATLAIGAITIGFAPIMAKAVSLSVNQISFYRFLFGTVSLAAYILFKRYKIDRAQLFRAAPFIFIAGLLFTVDIWFWHRSIVIVGAGLATLLANTQVFYLIILGWLIFRERPKWFFYPAMILAFSGLAVTCSPQINIQEFTDGTLGVVYGLLTGVSYALFALFLKKSTAIYTSRGPIPLLGITIVSLLASLLIMVFNGEGISGSIRDIGVMTFYGAGIHAFGWILISGAIQKVPLSLVSLLLLLQPTFATVFGSVFYGEPLGYLQVLGLVLTLTGIYFASLAKR